MKKRIGYIIYDHQDNPVYSSLKHNRKNSIGTLEPQEWKLRKSQDWTCQKVEFVFKKIK